MFDHLTCFNSQTFGLIKIYLRSTLFSENQLLRCFILDFENRFTFFLKLIKSNSIYRVMHYLYAIHIFIIAICVFSGKFYIPCIYVHVFSSRLSSSLQSSPLTLVRNIFSNFTFPILYHYPYFFFSILIFSFKLKKTQG